jgi:hypothetical protein
MRNAQEVTDNCRRGQLHIRGQTVEKVRAATDPGNSEGKLEKKTPSPAGFWGRGWKTYTYGIVKVTESTPWLASTTGCMNQSDAMVLAA